MRVGQGLRRAAQIKPNGTATIFAGRRRTWREVQDRVARLAGGLVRAGLSKGGRVAILSLNSDRYFEYLLAVPMAGGALVPINIRLAPPEIRYILEDSGAESIFVDDRFAPILETLKGKMGSVREIFYLGDGTLPSGMLAYEPLLLGAAPMLDEKSDDEDLAGIFYTGGTTGKAKGAMLSHRNLVTNATNIVTAFGYDAQSIYLHAAPMFHAADGASTLAITMLGGVHAFIPAFEPTDFLAAVQREKITHSLLVPTMINMLVNCPALAHYDVSTLK